MARIRTIKPEFFLHDGLAEYDPLDRLLFVGLWCLADKAGRLKDRYKTVKAQILPFDKHDVGKALSRLHAGGFIHRYRSGSDQFIQIMNWEKHQRPHHTEKESEITPPDLSPSLNGYNSVASQLSDGEVPDGKEGKGKEGKGEGKGRERRRERKGKDFSGRGG